MYGSNDLIDIYQKQMPNILYFQPFKCEDLLLFSFYIIENFKCLGFGLLLGQNFFFFLHFD